MSAGLRIAVFVSAPMPPEERIGTYAHSLALESIEAGHQPTLVTRGRASRARPDEVGGVPLAATSGPSWPARPTTPAY